MGKLELSYSVAESSLAKAFKTEQWIMYQVSMWCYVHSTPCFQDFSTPKSKKKTSKYMAALHFFALEELLYTQAWKPMIQQMNQ